MTAVSFYILAQIYNVIRSSRRPIITLGVDHFLVGHPAVAIAYTCIAHFAFERCKKSGLEVGFTLFARNGSALPGKITGGGPVSLNDGRIVCKMVELDRQAAASDFYNDLEARLKAAGATNLFSDPDKLVNINTVTGEAVVMKKGRLTSILFKLGPMESQAEANWFTLCFSTVAVVFLGVAVYFLVAESISPFDRPLRDFISAVGASLLMGLLAAGLVMLVQVLFIAVLGQNRKIAAFIAETSEMDKFFIGVAAGIGFIMAGCACFYL